MQNRMLATKTHQNRDICKRLTIKSDPIPGQGHVKRHDPSSTGLRVLPTAEETPCKAYYGEYGDM